MPNLIGMTITVYRVEKIYGTEQEIDHVSHTMITPNGIMIGGLKKGELDLLVDSHNYFENRIKNNVLEALGLDKDDQNQKDKKLNAKQTNNKSRY